MLSKDAIFTEFNKCKEPIDFSRKYMYFKKKNNLDSIEDVEYVLSCLEEINLLGALYIVTLKEANIAKSYIRSFLVRNRQEIIRRIQVDCEKSVYFMKSLYICMMYLSDEEKGELAKDIFSDNTYRKAGEQYIEYESIKATTDYYARIFLEAVTGFKRDILWESYYLKIVLSIYKARNEDQQFLQKIEMGLRKVQFGYVFDNNEAREYFEILCSKNMYKYARQFLDNFDGSEGLLGYELDEFAKKIMVLPDAGMLSLAKWCNKKAAGEYSYKQWCEDVLAVNNDEQCRRWVKLTVFYNELAELLKDGDLEGFDNKMLSACNYDMFYMNKVKYIKQLVECFSYICNTLILRKDDRIVRFLELLDNVNINAYRRLKHIAYWNQKGTVRDDYDYDEIKDVLLENYSVSQAIYIYMNTHLKSIINIEDFIEGCARLTEEDLYELFKDYPIECKISKGYRMNSVRDKLYATPIRIATNVAFSDYEQIRKSYGNKSLEAKAFNRKMFRSLEEWYSDNKGDAELIENDDICKVFISKFVEDQGVFVVDFILEEDVKEKRLEDRNVRYPSKVINWLAKIQEAKKVMPWNERNSVYGVRNIQDIDLRLDISIEILNTMEILQDDVTELEKFISLLSNPPLEEINEARYIPTQKRFEFYIPEYRYKDFINTVNEKAKSLLNNKDLPKYLRKDIYLNSIIKKFYELRFACEQFGEELYKNTADEAFVFALKFEERIGDEYFFSTKHFNTVSSIKPFIYKGEVFDELKEGMIYLVTLDRYDEKQDCFILAEVNLKNSKTDMWGKYRRRLRDIKTASSSKELQKIKEDLGRYDIRITSNLHIRQFVHELNLIFIRNGFSIDASLKAIDAIGDKNPFAKQGVIFEGLKEDFMRDYEKSYIRFLEDYSERYKSTMGFCDLYFKSYLKVYIDFNRLLDDISSEKNTKEDIINYCRYKGYCD